MTDLSVVLISKNQEWNISRLIESVLRETALVQSREIVLVDSASTDRTAEIASNYPISVLKLSPDQRLTAAAGRYIGYHHTTGDLVLFLDGDMALCQGWLRPAVDILFTKKDVAVVCGWVIDRPLTQQSEVMENPEPDADSAGVSDVQHGGGAAMYRRSVLERVGTFNPYLFSDEEPELCLRIRNAGYRVVRLPRAIVFHYTAPAEAISTLIGRRSRRLWLGYGQNLRYFLGKPLLWPYLRERGWALTPAIMLFLGLVFIIISVITHHWVWLAVWGALLFFMMTVIVMKKHSLTCAFYTLLQRLFILDGTLRGFFLTPYDPASYPGKFEVIRQGDKHPAEMNLPIRVKT